MAFLNSIVDQQQPVRILKTLLQTGAIPHALLFVGIEGVGKRTAAEAFAMACNCPTLAERLSTGSPIAAADVEPCGQCRSCRKIRSGTHPDVLHLKPSGVSIRVDQVRELAATLTLKPYEARIRTVILHAAQTLNPQAGNALLKILEEPPDRTIFLLTAPQTADLMPTILSRCQVLHFYPVSRGRMVEMLQSEGLEADAAAMLAAMAEGSPQRARQLQAKDFDRRRDWCIRASGLEQPERLATVSCSPLLAFAEVLAANKDRALEALETLTIWLRDLVVVRYAPELIVNVDRRKHLQAAADQTPVEWLLRRVEIIQSARRALEANANLRLTLEVMMLRMAGTASPEG